MVHPLVADKADHEEHAAADPVNEHTEPHAGQPHVELEHKDVAQNYAEQPHAENAHRHGVAGIAAAAQGVVMELRQEQDGRVRRSAVLLQDSFARAMQLLRYLCENGVGPEQWLEVLEDVHQPYQLLDTSKNAINIAEEPVFCGICRF